MARLAFFGTPDFSLPSLRATHQFCQDFSHELSLVVCQGDKPQGRGQHLQSPPVKKLAEQLNLLVAQPETLKKNTPDGDRFYEQFAGLNIDLAVVVAYGRIITDRLLKTPRSGFVNVHASLLPRFRGAAPIQRAIEAGDRKTGVCLMDMVKKLDEGDTYVCEYSPILPFDTSETLFHRLAHLGGHSLYRHLDDLLHRRLKKHPQDAEGVVYAHMLLKEEGLLNFKLPGAVLSHKVQAFDPWPSAFGYIRNKRIKFFNSFFIAGATMNKSVLPGTVVTIKPFLGIKTIDGIIYFQWIQVEGKKVLSIKEALLGFPINVGEQIETSPR
jgi:methionyl-tRNA formyltransferase